MRPRILIVEDQLEILDITSRFLTKQGFEVIALSEGKPAYAKVLTARPDIILLDMMLEDTTGLEVCQAIKSNPELHSIPVLLATGNANIEDEITDEHLKPDGYILKPFDIEDLIEQIKKMLS
jgi:DNA-binding response OmpR family regulator